MRGRSSIARALGVIVVGWVLSASCAGKSDRVDGDGATGGEAGGATGGSTGDGGSAPRAGRGGTSGGTGQGGTSGAGATDGGAGAAGDPGGGTGGTGGAGEGGDPPGGAGAGGSAGSRPVAGVCSSPTAWSEDLEECGGGFVHRPAARSCPVPVRDELIEGLAGNAGVESCVRPDCRLVPNECTRDADCPENAFCLREFQQDDFDVSISHTCNLACASDDECGPGSVCVCDHVVQNATRMELTMGVCTPATCRTDSDCGSGSFCISPLNVPERSGVGSAGRAAPVIGSFHCQTSDDECFGPATCPSPPDDDCVLYESCETVDGRFECGWRNESILCSP